jgi:hypothetical protein
MKGLPQFRTYEEMDLDAVLNLCAAEGWATYVEDRARSHRVFTAPGVVSIVATVDDEVAGFAYFQTDGGIQAFGPRLEETSSKGSRMFHWASVRSLE